MLLVYFFLVPRSIKQTGALLLVEKLDQWGRIYLPPCNNSSNNNKKHNRQNIGIKSFQNHWRSANKDHSSLTDGKQMKPALQVPYFILFFFF